MFQIAGVNIVEFALDFLAFTGMYLLISLSLNLELGYLGIPDFGKGLFVAVGGLITGTFVDRLVPWMFDIKGGFANSGQVALQGTAILQHDIALSLGIFVASLAIAALVGAVVGYVISFPVIRLQSHYLGIFLFIMSFFFLSFSNTFKPLAYGTYGISVPDVFGWAHSNRYVAVTVAIVLVAMAGYYLVGRVTKSPFGRLLKAIREDETAAKSFGKDIVRAKINIMVLSSALAAVAGSMYTYYTLAALPEAYTLLSWTVLPWLMVIMGGVGNNRGVFVGVMAIIMIEKIVTGFKFFLAPVLPFDVAWVEYLIIPILLAVVILVKPDGILKEVNLHLTKVEGPPPKKNEDSTPQSPPSGTTKEG